MGEIVPNDAKNTKRRRDVINAKNYFSKYCGSTSIHGMQYLGERGRYIIEKIVWLLIIITVATFSTILILKTYNKWVTTPVIVTFATAETPISTIPFPAVTICPEVKTDVEKFNFSDVFLKKVFLHELTQDEEDGYQSLSMVCNINAEANITSSDPIAHDSVIENLLTLLPDFNPTNVTQLLWRGKPLDIYESLAYTFTREGICYSFNMLGSQDILTNPEEFTITSAEKANTVRQWSLDKGYLTSDVSESYPMRTFLPGPHGGLLLDGLTTFRSDLDYLCTESLQGYKVVLHHPAEWPNMDRHFRVPLNSAVYVGIEPKVTTVSPTLKHYDPERRRCYFTDERRLAYFLNYTQNNCLQECLSNYTRKNCNCIGFYMPKDKDYPICGVGSLECLHESKIDYLKYDKDECSCLPSCTSLEYDMEISLTDWDWHRAIDALRAMNRKSIALEFDKVHLSKLAIYFKSNQFLSSERNELYGTVDFLSSVGGLLGLFIGISITSFIEVLYFCTLRLYCNCKKYGRKYWSGEPDLVDEDEQNDAIIM